MELAQMESVIESMLFAAGSPLERGRIAAALEIDEKTCESVLARMMDRYNTEPRGIQILTLGDCYQLASRPEYAEYIRTALHDRRAAPLTGASLEVLAIVAYNQPVPKGYVDQIRGVDSGSAIATLIEKGLLEERGRLDVPGRPRLYGTTSNFLRCFGLSSVEELPALARREEPASELEGQQNLEAAP